MYPIAVLLFLFSITSKTVTASIEKKACMRANIHCYIKEKYLKMEVPINEESGSEALEFVNDMKKMNPALKCNVNSCNSEFKIWFLDKVNANINDSTQNMSTNNSESNPSLKKEDFLRKEIEKGNPVNATVTGNEEKSLPLPQDAKKTDIDTKDEDKLVNNGNQISDVFDDNKYIDFSKNNSEAGYLDGENMTGYIMKFTISPGFKTEGGNRSKRAAGNCAMSDLKNSEMTCEKWPDLITCWQKCSFGHGLDHNKRTKQKHVYKCRLSEGKWKPKFKDCKPFVNCNVALAGHSAGKLKCGQQHHFKPPYCKIKCGSGKSKKYHCSHQLEKQLPKCAIMKKQSLISAP